MNTTKKLLVIVMVALVAAVSVMPSTFSWYSHNASLSGESIHYSDSHDISIKSAASTISVSTVKTDEMGNTANAQGTAYGNVTGGISIAKNAQTKYQYYKTTITNTGSNDVNVDLTTSDLGNDADFYIGTVSPTLNEKAYAAKPSRQKVSTGKVRVYFKTRSDFSSFWNAANNMDAASNNNLDVSHSAGSSNTTKCDINIAYKADSEPTNYTNDDKQETLAKMAVCPTATESDSTGTTTAFYYDLPSDTEYFYFFNHWYLAASTDREWNRTIDITTLTPGTLYYLTGGKVDEKWKEYNTKDVDTELFACESYYTNVEMSLGNSVFADIGLKKESENDDDENFVPEYYGADIEYKVQGATGIVTVNKDGLITPVAAGTTTIRTTITGKYGDSKYYDTSVSIPTNIAQVPILKNILVEKKDPNASEGTKVEVYWYAINKSTTENMTTSNIFFTI